MRLRWVAVLALLVAGLITGLWLGRVLARVPAAGPTLATATDRILPQGLKISVGPGIPLLGPVRITSQFPPAGWIWPKALAVRLQATAPSIEVTVPALVGRFESDAEDELYRAGLESGFTMPPGAGSIEWSERAGSTIEPASGERADYGAIVVTQSPPAGTLVRLGDRADYQAEPAHRPGPGRTSATSEAVRRVHGVFYLRYGVQGARDCGEPCHGPETCARAGCHLAQEYRQLHP